MNIKACKLCHQDRQTYISVSQGTN